MDRVIFNETLISEVYNREPLWKTSHLKYKDIKTTDMEWNAIASHMNCTVKEVQDRWRNLRDTFVKKYKHYQSLERSGLSADERRSKIGWTYFNMMLFLKESINGRNENPSTGSLVLSSPECSTQEVWMDLNNDANPAFVSDKRLKSIAQSYKGRKRKIAVPNSVDHKMRMIQEQHDSREQDYFEMFALSLVPHLKKTPENLLGLCKLQLLQVVLSFSAGKIPKLTFSPEDIFPSDVQ